MARASAETANSIDLAMFMIQLQLVENAYALAIRVPVRGLRLA